MSKAVIIQESYGQLKTASTSDYDNSKVSFKDRSTRIIDDLHTTKSIKNKSFPLTNVSYDLVNAKIESVLPFRVKFTTIGIDGYGPGNPAPIGIAVVGINNYIL